MPYSTIGKILLEFNSEIMQRKILLIISLFVFISYSQTTIAQSKKTSDAEDLGLKERVMSVENKFYKEKKILLGLIHIKEKISYLYTIYNKKGNFLFETWIKDFKEEHWEKSFYKYNDRDICIEQIDTIYENGKYVIDL